MGSIIDFLKGKKTYIVSVVGILSALLLYLDGSVDLAGLIGAILAALGVSGLRAGVDNAAEKAAEKEADRTDTLT